jgi:hypothetical protein
MRTSPDRNEPRIHAPCTVVDRQRVSIVDQDSAAKITRANPVVIYTLPPA